MAEENIKISIFVKAISQGNRLSGKCFGHLYSPGH